MSENIEEQIRVRNREAMKEDKRRRFQYLNQFAKKHEIVFAGSSLMEQFPISEFIVTDSIGLTIYNRGIGSYVTEDLLRSLNDCILDLEPKSVYLSIGTNDLNSPKTEIEDLIQKLRELVKKIKERLPECRIYFLALYPVNREEATIAWVKKVLEYRTNEKLAIANQKLKEMAREENVGFIDCNKNLIDENGNLRKEFTVDGIHMYANGYQEVYKELLPVLRREEYDGSKDI